MFFFWNQLIENLILRRDKYLFDLFDIHVLKKMLDLTLILIQMYWDAYRRIQNDFSNRLVDRRIGLLIFKVHKLFYSEVPDNIYLIFEILRIWRIGSCPIICSVTPSNIWWNELPSTHVFEHFILPFLKAGHVICAQHHFIGSLQFHRNRIRIWSCGRECRNEINQILTQESLHADLLREANFCRWDFDTNCVHHVCFWSHLSGSTSVCTLWELSRILYDLLTIHSVEQQKRSRHLSGFVRPRDRSAKKKKR